MSSQQKALSSVVVAPRITIREKIHQIATLLRQQTRTTFSHLVTGKRSRLDIVVTFLALLELVKRQLVRVQQESMFSDISLEPTENWKFEEEIETEFGE
jgi:segregation and condensation protein A